MSNVLDPKIITKVAERLDIEPAFVEKDWCVVQILKHLTSFHNENGIDIVFSGGTSLSKGYGLIKRFSEDIDFILSAPEDISHSGRRSFRKSVIANIVSDNRFKIDKEVIVRNESRFFRMPVEYDMKFPSDSLRPYLQVEMAFKTNQLPTVTKDIRSFISEFSGGEAETQISCMSATETAANKLSALTWRVVNRNRESQNYDPRIIRHLHDLKALRSEIDKNQEQFTTCACQSLKQDQKRGCVLVKNMTSHEKLQKACDLLSEDSIYRDEYKQFVQSTSYAAEDEQIAFDAALASLKELTQWLL